MYELKLLTILSKELVSNLDVIEKKAAALKNKISQEGLKR